MNAICAVIVSRFDKVCGLEEFAIKAVRCATLLVANWERSMRVFLFVLSLIVVATPAPALCLRVEGAPHDKLTFFRFALTQFEGIEIASISGCSPQVGVTFLYQNLAKRRSKSAYAVAAATDNRKISENPKRVVFPIIVTAHGNDSNGIIYRLSKGTVEQLLAKKEKKT